MKRTTSVGNAFAGICKEQLVQHVHSTLCRVVIDFLLSSGVRRRPDAVWTAEPPPCDAIVTPSGEKLNTLDFTYLSAADGMSSEIDLLVISSDCQHQRQVALGQLLGELIAGKKLSVVTRPADVSYQLQHQTHSLSHVKLAANWASEQ